MSAAAIEEAMVVTLKRLPAALALGLPAALLGHAFLFGSGHEAGGAAHGLFVAVAAAFSLGFAIFFGALAWRGGRASAGSVLAARLADRMPSPLAIFAAAAAYFTICESFESQHAASAIPLTAALLLLASWLVCELGRAAIRAIAETVVTVIRVRFASRQPQWHIFAEPQLAVAPSPATRRRFARPPPALSARA